MPNNDGKLTDEQKQKVDVWLKGHWISNRICPISGHNKWVLGQHFVQPLIWMQGGISIGGPGYPQVMLICEACGFTYYFNAVVMGLFPPSEEPKSGK